MTHQILGILVYEIGLTETKLFHFHSIFKNRGQGGVLVNPPEPPLDLPLSLDAKKLFGVYDKASL